MSRVHLRPFDLAALLAPAALALSACTTSTSSSALAGYTAPDAAVCDAAVPPTPDAAPPPKPDAGAPSGCTRTLGYWKTHNELATVPALQIDWPAPYDENQTLCGQTLLDILKTPSRGDAWTILAHQFIAAELNVASGASTTTEVDQALAQASDFLDNHCGGVPASEAPDAIALADTLDDYNNGEIGPGECD